MALKNTENEKRWNKKSTPSARPVALSAVSEGRRNGASTSTEDDIRRRAYEIYLQRGNAPGSQHEDWLAAEREIRTRAAGTEGRR